MSNRLQAGWIVCALAALLLGGPLPAQPAGRAVLETSGYVVPSQPVTVSPRLAGIVAQLPIEESQVVKQGEVIGRLEATEYELKLRIAEAELKGAQAVLAKAAISSEKDTVIASAAVEAAKGRLELARWYLDGTIIRAPITGTVLVKRAEVGSFVNPRGLSGVQALCEMADLRRLEVDVSLQERDLPRVSKGQPCQVRLDAYPKTTYRGVVVRLLPVADRAKGAVNVRVRLEVPEKDEQLRPDMRALVQFLSKQ
jgi:RND family efflux transporter MFP subunit